MVRFIDVDPEALVASRETRQRGEFLADWKPVAIDFFQVMGLETVSAIRGEKKLGIASSPQERRTRRRLTLLTRHASRYSSRATWRPSRCVSFPRLHHPFARRARARGRTADARWRKTLNHRRSLASACFSPRRARDGVANERLTHLIPVPLSQQTEKAYQKQFGVNVGYVPPRRAPIRVTPDPASDFARPPEESLTARSHPLPFRRFAASTKKKAPGKAGTRYYKNVGLGFKTPKAAIEGAYRRDARAPGRRTRSG